MTFTLNLTLTYYFETLLVTWCKHANAMWCEQRWRRSEWPCCL